ncbi:MAG: hypothetical protein ABIH65_02870 [Nanoarchaeota archaeon]
MVCYLENIFSEENIESYSRACLELATDVPEYRNKEDSRKFNTLVIPSRGAVPFFLGMVYSMNKFKDYGGAQESFYNSLCIPNIISSLLSEEIKYFNKPNKESINVLLIPFTADLNLSKFDKTLTDEEFVPKTRKYWSNVTRSFFKESSERVKDPYFISFADCILSDIEGRKDLARIYEEFPTITSFSMIDTAISGRAATHILGSFDELELKSKNSLLLPSTFLVIDEMGKKLKKEYFKYLVRKRVDGLLNSYPIPRIVSEDEGASLLGVASVIYPSIMRASRQFYLNDEEFFIGAGTWHNSYDLIGDYFKNFQTFMKMIYKGIDLVFKKEHLREDSSKEYDSFKENRTSFLERAEEVKLLAQMSEDIRTLKPAKNYSFENCYETSSHVFHAPFTEKSERKFTHDLFTRKIPGLRYIGPKKEDSDLPK